jgi:hypothetical protein
MSLSRVYSQLTYVCLGIAGAYLRQTNGPGGVRKLNSRLILRWMSGGAVFVAVAQVVVRMLLARG